MKNIFCLLSFSLLNIYALGNPIDPEAARALAKQYLTNPQPVAQTGGRIRTLAAEGSTAKPAYYLFGNADGNGYVIVAADDRLGGVLGYGTRGNIASDNLPQGLQSILADYTAAAQAIEVDSVSVVPTQIVRQKPYVEPLVEAKWSQVYPWNYYAPTLSTGSKAYTGCVATAVAQMMSAHRWPKARPAGSERGDGKLALDTYDWDNILADYGNGNYTEDQAQAVGVLMRDVDNGLGMIYTTMGGVSDEGKAMYALKELDYTVRTLEKDILRGGEFVQAIYNELSLGCPVVMTGGDHAFVFDGYDSKGYVHANFGWAGEYDGYFDIDRISVASSTTTAGDYYNGQVALFAHPNNGEYAPLTEKPAVLSVNNSEGLQISESETTVNGTLTANIRGVGARNLVQDEDYSFTGYFGIGLFAADGTCLHVFEWPGLQSWSSYYTSFNFEDFTLNFADVEGPADGAYCLRPVGKRRTDKATNTFGNWTLVVNANSVPITVSDGIITVEQTAQKPSLRIVGKPEQLAQSCEYDSRNGAVAVNVENSSRFDGRGNVKLTFCGTGSIEGETYEAPDMYMYNLLAARMDTTQWLLPFPVGYTSTSGTFNMKAGKYTMRLVFTRKWTEKVDGVSTEKSEDVEIAVPSDFLYEVLPSSYENRLAIYNVNVKKEDLSAETLQFYPSEKAILETSSARATYTSSNSVGTQLRYKIKNLSTGGDAYTGKAFNVSLTRNAYANLSSSTRDAVDLSSFAEGWYEVHVEEGRNGAWTDLWCADAPRKKFQVLAALPHSLSVTTQEASQITGVAGIATFSAPFNAVCPEGVRAWYIQQIDGEKATLVEVPQGSAIPAGEGVLLTTDVASETFQMAEAASEPVADLSGNQLQSTPLMPRAIAGNDCAYVLSNADGATAFRKAQLGSILPQYKAYLRNDATSGESVAMLFPGTPTGLSAVTTDSADPIRMYDLNGRPVLRPVQKGVYVRNGRKVVR